MTEEVEVFVILFRERKLQCDESMYESRSAGYDQADDVCIESKIVKRAEEIEDRG